ncbi:MAG: hypothetical protein AB8G18_07275 [Gammaproteobacteria bacterium]
MGVTSDRPEADLEDLFRNLDEALRKGHPNFVLSEASMLSDAFLDTTSSMKMRAVVWILNPQMFGTWRGGSTLLKHLLVRWVQDRERHDIIPVVYVLAPESAEGVTLTKILGELGLTTRGPDSQSNDAIVTAVQRTDGVVVVCLPGPIFQPTGERAAWYEDVCLRRRQAKQNGDKSAREAVDEELIQYLETHLSPLQPEGAVAPEFARQLRELMWRAVTEGQSEDLQRSIIECLAEREAGLVIHVDPTTRATTRKLFRDHEQGLEVFPDLSLATEALAERDVNELMALGCVSYSEVLGWMASEGCGLAIRLGNPDDPTQAFFMDADTVASLALEDSG